LANSSSENASLPRAGSSDAHFRVLRRILFPKIDLLTSDEFLELLGKTA